MYMWIIKLDLNYFLIKLLRLVYIAQKVKFEYFHNENDNLKKINVSLLS